MGKISKVGKMGVWVVGGVTQSGYTAKVRVLGKPAAITVVKAFGLAGYVGLNVQNRVTRQIYRPYYHPYGGLDLMRAK